jgi:ubiquitin C-terminal hydrolase
VGVQVCYAGRHYVAYVRQQGGLWAVYSDEAVAPVGAWADMCEHCVAGRFQPSVLFFEAA